MRNTYILDITSIDDSLWYAPFDDNALITIINNVFNAVVLMTFILIHNKTDWRRGLGKRSGNFP